MIIFSSSIFMLLFWSSFCSKLQITPTSSGILIKYEYQSNNGETFQFEQIAETPAFIGANKMAERCEDIPSSSNEICYKWGNVAQFSVNNVTDEESCQQFKMKIEKDFPLQVTFNISNMHLYGGSEQTMQYWPVEKQSFKDYSYVSKEKDSQAALEPYWLTSNGFFIYVDRTVPLFISLDNTNKTFTIIANIRDPYIRQTETTILFYTMCKYENAKVAHQHAIKQFLGKPTAIPDTKMVKYPIWSTWAKYKVNINEKIVLDYANEIVANKFESSQMEIDDKWENCYGSLTVDPKRFPDMKRLVNKLKSLGFRVTAWTHPFINVDCEPYHSEGEKKGYFVKHINGSVLTWWWNGKASYVDFTNPEAAQWYENRLKKLTADTGIDSFKFDSGESSFSPTPSVFHVMNDEHPENILHDYVKTASKFGPLTEVRSARNTQQLPIFVRMIDRESTWTYKLGLPTLITSLLHLNMIGYPFVLPDMIGGNAYNNDTIDRELFIRWVQANVFMPAIQYSCPPWDFGPNVTELSRRYTELHYKYSDKIIQLMKKSVENGSPVNPPIWWIDPYDPEALASDSEYLLGEEILVAPVLEKGARSRDIYLPMGKWRDEANKDHPIIDGPIWLRNYSAELDTLPYFTKVISSDASTSLLNISLIIIIILICTQSLHSYRYIF